MTPSFFRVTLIDQGQEWHQAVDDRMTLVQKVETYTSHHYWVAEDHHNAHPASSANSKTTR
ncbi:hypothetical protein [Streptococcus jiangjianxini]|uniref:hypothetical protein n=1 Tax=Streptococcus jiangjianxini TaxID=3161189 RepID=UPI0032ED0F56